MKKLLLAIFISMLTIASYAQNQYATTTDGKNVLLKSDGTWEYVKGNTTSTNSLYSGSNKSTASNPSRNTNASNARTSSSSTKKSTGRTYIRGPRGGCYYINSNGNKTYVDRSLCN